jgi:predicted TIM-barrel fold metal-dependent hydrolase
MVELSRRQWLGVAGAMTACSGREVMAQTTEPAQDGGKLPLTDFEPRSMLQVPETKVEKSRFPVIDIHTHLSWSPGLTDPAPGGGRFSPLAPPAELLPVMDRRNIRLLVNVTGGYGTALEQTIEHFSRKHPDRFMTFTEPSWHWVAEANYPQRQGDEIEKAHGRGARGVKILKTLGLYLREQVSKGPLVKVDDKRFDPMWEAAGAKNMPVIIHVSDPEAFFLPIDRYNERYEELHAHPDWSFYGDFPSNKELHEARNRLIARHPKTQFILAHAGNTENLAWVAEWMDDHPNIWVEIGARIGELGRQPRTCRKFFEKYQDRILFGTDAVPHGDEYPQQVYGDALYQIYYRFLETEDEYFDYSPARVPPQGRWRIYGMGLPEQILRKVYHDNAARLLGLS